MAMVTVVRTGACLWSLGPRHPRGNKKSKGNYQIWPCKHTHSTVHPANPAIIRTM